MNIGPLRSRITIKSPTEVRSPSGETTLNWDTTLAEVWADVNGLSTRDILQAQQANVIASHRIRIRHLDGVTHLHRIIHKGRTMEIASVTSREHDTIMDILAREVQ